RRLSEPESLTRLLVPSAPRLDFRVVGGPDFDEVALGHGFWRDGRRLAGDGHLLEAALPVRLEDFGVVARELRISGHQPRLSILRDPRPRPVLRAHEHGC